MYGKYTHAIHAGLLLIALIAPFGIYPVFLMKMLCFALYACAFNLLLGYAGLLSFGHAAFFGGSAYVCAGLAKHEVERDRVDPLRIPRLHLLDRRVDGGDLVNEGSAHGAFRRSTR